MQPVYLIDASIYIFQSHFSPYVECYDRQGGDLSAVYGFTQFLLQFLRRERPAYIAVAHDSSLFCGFRHELCPVYKSNRELPDENLEMQLNACSEVCAILGLPTYASKVYEADDIIGTLASRVRHESSQPEISIISRDKDLAQLLKEDGDCLWDYVGNRKRNRTDIFSEFGVHPQQFADYLGLIGDSVDCISGVPGIGPVKATALLQEFHSLDNLYANLDAVAGLPMRGAARVAALLQEHAELAQLSRKLATIVCDISDADEACAGSNLEALARGGIDLDGLRGFLDRYRFKTDDSKRIYAMGERVATL